MPLNETERNHQLLSIAVAKKQSEYTDANGKTCVVCQCCHGTGLKPGPTISDLSCPNCNGSGYLLKLPPSPLQLPPMSIHVVKGWTKCQR